MESFFRRDEEAERQKFFFDRYHHLIRGVALNVDNVGIDVIAQPGIDLGLEGWEVGYAAALALAAACNNQEFRYGRHVRF